MGSTLTLTSTLNGDGRPLYQCEKDPVPTYTCTCKGRNVNYGRRSANNRAVSDMKSYAKSWMFVR